MRWNAFWKILRRNWRAAIYLFVLAALAVLLVVVCVRRGHILVKLYCVDNEHLMRTIFDGILRIQGVASTETQISLQEAFQRQVNIDFIEE